ncbi:hypothetical protein [Paenibacillus marinisediminis]
MIFKKGWEKDKSISTMSHLTIVSDAAISSLHVVNGKNVPLVIVDTTDLPEVERAILTHTTIKNGHVNTKWGKSAADKYITLVFSLLDPVPIEFFVSFNAEKQGGVVDLIIRSQLLYIQPGKPGDRLSNTINSPRLLVEIPSTHFSKEWNLIHQRIMTKRFIKMGLKKKDAKKAALDFHKEWGIIREFRLK